MTTLSRSSRGFGYLDVVVAIGIIVVVAAFMLPVRRNQNGGSNRVKCASNLRQIGQAFLLYSNENRQAWPRLRNVEDGAASYYTGVDDTNPFDGTGDPGPNDVTAVLYLLVRTQDIGTEVFTCPSSMAEKYSPNDVVSKHSNFPSRTFLSYSVAMPYVSGELKAKGYLWNSNVGPEFAMAGDMSPGGDASKLNKSSRQSEIKPFNTRNHDGDGQNVLFGDGHVEFTNTPLVGVNKDNIYAPAVADDGTGTSLPPGTVPQHANDSVLLPTDKD